MYYGEKKRHPGGRLFARPYSRQGYAYKLHFRQDYALMPLLALKRPVWEINELRGVSRQGYDLDPARIWFKLQSENILTLDGTSRP